MKIGITCYPTYGGSGALATELGIALAARAQTAGARAAPPSRLNPSCPSFSRPRRRPPLWQTKTAASTPA